LLAAIAVVLVAYVCAAIQGLPQTATEMIKAAASEQRQTSARPSSEAAQKAALGEQRPPLWTVLPFALLLLGIALFPLLPPTVPWWQSDWQRFCFAAGLAAVTLLYYLCLADYPVQGHWPAAHVSCPPQTGLNLPATWDVIANAMLHDYVPFIVLLLSLYTISGGIRIEGDLRAHPLTNAALLAAGGLLASFIGTTGAAMLLIRPLLETNQQRRHVQHTVVFFIFIVCNCGGCLLPIGDPPLFLGYLRGVPFLWTLRLWKAWLLVNALLLLIYYLWDRFWYYPREQPADVFRDETSVRPLQLRGLWPNAIFLGGVVLAVALLDPGMPVPGTHWHPWLYLREATQLGLVGLSLLLGRREVRRANKFHYGAMIEVAVLFMGIFICMQPPLQILAVEGGNLGLTRPWHYFWAAGGLSSVLDNAPAYVVFVETARSLTARWNLTPAVAGVGADLLAAVSLGSVLMGANTYIGNGPNFMVKAIAEKSGVPMPSFFGYLLYSGFILLPLFALVTVLFLR
jgi:Na+/H+ antiporter NhaD/arsenite permease-like protein